LAQIHPHSKASRDDSQPDCQQYRRHSASGEQGVAAMKLRTGRGAGGAKGKPHHPHGDDRERITGARQAAEALFTPKRQPVEPSVSESVRSAERSARKPRVLAILSPAPVRDEEVAAPVNPEPQTTRQVLRSQHARIRTCVQYGLTVPQVAEVYGVAVGVIERILREG
jgi:hypothetical protein